ncbi:hypothetical protein [Dactylosporangium sp. NPDC000521]|uniref:hypothetical protein n=1 Tax=Dactylosporangium sp. NPDC000521 TaxID=3363975 RepID=UPI0036B1A70C
MGQELAVGRRSPAGRGLGVGRRVAAGLVLAVVLVFGWGSPAGAHGGASVVIHSDGRGSVWITAQWQDGHPINEPTVVTLSASPAGASPGASGSGQASAIVGERLTQTGDERGTQTWSGVLPAGAWRVAVDLGAPVEGHCQALVPSAGSTDASVQAVEVACLIPASGAVADGQAGDGESSAGSLAPLWVTLSVLVIAGLIGAEVVRRRRGRTGQARESSPAAVPSGPPSDPADPSETDRPV